MKVRLIENVNSDLGVVNAARVSMRKEHTEFDPDKDTKLINYLAKHGHWTPFSHPRMTFASLSPIIKRPDLLKPEDVAGMVWGREFRKVRHSLYGWVRLIREGLVEDGGIASYLWHTFPVSMSALDPNAPITTFGSALLTDQEFDPYFIDYTLEETVPIFVARQRFKHMVGFTYNEVSRRYVDDEPEFYVPDGFRERPEGGIKQGSRESFVASNDDFMKVYKCRMAGAKEAYYDMLAGHIAPEQARIILPQSMETSYHVTGSLVAWKRAYQLRSDPHAQKEIRDLAEMWKNTLPIS